MTLTYDARSTVPTAEGWFVDVVHRVEEPGQQPGRRSRSRVVRWWRVWSGTWPIIPALEEKEFMWPTM